MSSDFNVSLYARATEFSPIVRVFPKITRNKVCPFSQQKFKKCCGKTGQNYCDKAKENLKNHLQSLKENNDKSS